MASSGMLVIVAYIEKLETISTTALTYRQLLPELREKFGIAPSSSIFLQIGDDKNEWQDFNIDEKIVNRAMIKIVESRKYYYI